MSDIKNADLIRAVLDGKTVQCMGIAGKGWLDYVSPKRAIAALIHEWPEGCDMQFRLKPEIEVRWLPVFDSLYNERQLAAKHGHRQLLRMEFDQGTGKAVSVTLEDV